MKAADVSAARINMVLRHKKSGRVYKTILNQQGYSWMQVRNGKLVVNARQYHNGQSYGPIRLIDPEHYVGTSCLNRRAAPSTAVEGARGVRSIPLRGQFQ